VCRLVWCHVYCHVAGLLRWPYHQLPRGILVGPTSWLTSLVWGPHVLRWRNRCVSRGTCLLTWPILVPPRGTPSLLCYFIYSVFSHTQFAPKEASVPKLYRELPWSNLSSWLIHLICFYLPWIYFNSSTYPKIMKISPKNP
jgi:hypothetical protein